MSFDVDEDILQDFLVEAGEILEQLQEQLVDLENNPEDADLLNAIFRGYHTVKGGAGFLSLTELVEICHGAENVFDVMRNGQRTLTPELMDIILQATDVVVEMFERVKARDPLEPADAHLVDVLHKLSRPESPDENIFENASTPAAEPEVVAEEPELVIEEPAPSTTDVGDSSGGIDEITEDEFEALLDELHGSGAPGQSAPAKSEPAKSPVPAASSDSDDITDEEFEALLDDLHGKGKFGGEEKAAAAPAPASATPSSSATSAGDEEITDGILKKTKRRFNWLLLNLFTAVVASIVIGFFQDDIEKVVALAVLMPIVASMGGNAGMQTLAVTIRTLATNELTKNNFSQNVIKEFSIGILNGFIFAAISAIIVQIWFQNITLSLIISISMILNMIVAGLFGILVPVTLKKMKIDPAIASSVFVTTITDVIGFLSFLGIGAYFFLN